jgi:hypothetical protein
MTRRGDEPPKGDDTGWNDESAPETPPAAPTHEEWGYPYWAYCLAVA